MSRYVAEFSSGLLLGLHGLLAKELHTRTRGWRPMWLLSGYLGLLALAVAGFLALVERTSGTIPVTIGTMLFGALASATILLLAFITPALTVGAISGERERRTLDLLLVTPASALGLAGGKLLASLLYILFLLTASLPAFALVYLFGGVPPEYLVVLMTLGSVTALAHAALGLLLSALLKRTLIASIVAYLVALFLLVGVPVGAMLAGLATQTLLWTGVPASPDPPVPAAFPPSAYLYISPLLSLIWLLAGLFFSSGVFGQTPTASSLPITHSLYLAQADLGAGQIQVVVAWAPWVYQLAFSAGFTLLSLLLTALALEPLKPWRGLRAGRRDTGK